MNRTLVTLMISAIAGMVLTSCRERTDDNLNREILLETVWKGEQFHSATLANVSPLPSDAGEDAEFFYIFRGDGIMNVFAGDEDSGTAHFAEMQPLTSLRYIYTPQNGEIVIEEYGLLLVKEITVERLRLEGIAGSLDLRFHSDINTSLN